MVPLNRQGSHRTQRREWPIPQLERKIVKNDLCLKEMTARYSGGDPLSYTVSERSWGGQHPAGASLQRPLPPFYAGNVAPVSHSYPFKSNYTTDQQGGPHLASTQHDPRVAQLAGCPIEVLKRLGEMRNTISRQSQQINMLETRLRQCMEMQGGPSARTIRS